MTEQSGNTLQYIEQLLREGGKQDALPLLAGYLRQYPNSAQGWWLLSFVIPDPNKQIECVERVLKIDVNNKPASDRLKALKGNLIVQKPVAPFIDLILPAPEEVSEQFSQPNSLPSVSQKAAPRKKADKRFLQYGVLGLMGCAAVSVFAFAAMMIVKGYSSPPAQQVGLVSSTQIFLPPTWTPTPTATLISSPTPISTNTPLGMSPLDALPTKSIPRSQIGPFIGYYAPDFGLTDVTSKEKVKLSSYEGQVVVIFFWATWCPYCKEEMSTVQMIYQAYQDDGLVVLAVDVGENAALARRYRDIHSLTFSILDDSDRDTYSKYQVSGFPTLFFVDRSGVISSTKVGVLDYWGFNKKVREMLDLAP